MPKLSIPSKFHSFEIQKFLAPGLSGEVYLARYKDGSLVALKILDKEKERDRTVFGYFTNERTLLDEITRHRHHPHLVEYVTSNLTHPPYYIATRYVEGARSLASQLGRSMAPAHVVRIAEQIGAALDYLHYGHPTYSPIIHRDVKPNNILLDAADNAVLIDLSIASHPAYALEDERGLGTPQYMPPEQYSGAEVPATDQFALAAVVLHMLAGRTLLPANPKTAYKKLEQLRDTQYTEVRKQLGNRTHTADVIVRALTYDPAQRYQTCEEFAVQLRQALQQDGQSLVEAPRPIKVRRASGGSGSLGLWAMGIAGVVAALVLVIALAAGSAAGEAIATATPALAADIPTDGPAFVRSTPINGLDQPTSSPLLAVTAPPPTGEPAGASAGSVRIVANTEPLRASPSTDARVLLRMPRDAEAALTGNQRTTSSLIWYEVTYNGQTGWCRSLFCKPQAQPISNAPAPQTEPIAAVSSAPQPRPTQPAAPAAPPTPEGRRMPELVGKSEQEARALLKQAGIDNPVYADQQSRSKLGALFDQFPAGAVLSTQPRTGELVGQGMTIVLGVRAAMDDMAPPTVTPEPPREEPPSEPKPDAAPPDRAGNDR